MANERFDAFISYARAPSTRLAVDLQSSLEKFAKPWNRLRAVRVFRDDSSMSANSALWSTIESAMRDAQSFILLATPEAAASPYVNNEVQWWVHNKGADGLLLVHAGGHIDWNPRTGDFTDDSTAIPPALRGGYREEPRWADLTWFDAPGSLQRADPRFIERIADLSSGVRRIPRDLLIGENVRQHRKTVRLARAAIVGLSLLLVLAVVAGGFAVLQRGEAIKQRDAATVQSLIARVGQLSATASELASTDLPRAALLASSAYRSYPDAHSERALHDIVTTTPQLTGVVDFGEPVSAVDVTNDGMTVVVGTESGKVIAYDGRSGERRELMDLGDWVTSVFVSEDARTVAAGGTNSGVWADGRLTELPDTTLVAMSPSGRTTLVAPELPVDDEQYLEVRTADRAVRVYTEMQKDGNWWATLPDDRTVVVAAMSGAFMRASALTGDIEVEGSGLVAAWNLGLAVFSGDGSRFGYVSDRSNTVVWEFDNPPENLDDPVFMTDIAGVRPSDIALNHNGTRAAVATDGAIYVDELRPRGERGEAVVLRGAGARPQDIGFAADELLFSAAGSVVSLWDLDRTVALATSHPVEFGKTCNACGPPAVVVSPDARTALVGESTVLDLDTGRAVVYGPPGDSDETAVMTHLSRSAVWLDADRLFVYAPGLGRGLVLGGARAHKILKRLELPELNTSASRAALRADGKVAVVAESTLIVVDPETGEFQVATPEANAVSANGAYAIFAEWNYEEDLSSLDVIDTYSMAAVASLTVEGRLVDFVAHGRSGITVLRESRRGESFRAGAEVLRVGIENGSVQSVGRLQQPIAMGSVLVGLADQIYAENSGMVVRYDLADASALGIVPVTSAVKMWNGLGLTPDGRTLVIASEPTQTVLRLPVNVDAWLEAACTLVGRSVTTGDLATVVTPAEDLTPGCAEG